MRDLYGVQSARPARSPAVARSRAAGPGRENEARYEFLPVEGEGLHQIPVGPVHAGIIEPGHFRFTANGETVVRLEERLGYVHKGVEGCWPAPTIERGARIVGRISGRQHGRLCLGLRPRGRGGARLDGAAARACCCARVMAELERLAQPHQRCRRDLQRRQRARRSTPTARRCARTCCAAPHACFGHRLMMDRVVPGGVAADLSADGVGAIRGLLRATRGDARRDPAGLRLAAVAAGSHRHRPASFRPSWSASTPPAALSAAPAGRAFDARKRLSPMRPTTGSTSTLKTRTAGDVDARLLVRMDEIERELPILAPAAWPRWRRAQIRADAGRRGGRGRGAGRGLPRRCLRERASWRPTAGSLAVHARDASWFQWPLLEAAIEGNIVADFPLCNKSFNCSYSGHDL